MPNCHFLHTTAWTLSDDEGGENPHMRASFQKQQNPVRPKSLTPARGLSGLHSLGLTSLFSYCIFPNINYSVFYCLFLSQAVVFFPNLSPTGRLFHCPFWNSQSLMISFPYSYTRIVHRMVSSLDCSPELQLVCASEHNTTKNNLAITAPKFAIPTAPQSQ